MRLARAASAPARAEWRPLPGLPAEGAVRELGGFLQLLEIDAASVTRHSDGFERLRSGELTGIVIRDVYAPEVLSAAVDRLERHEPPFVQTSFPPPFRSFFYGHNLNLTGPEELAAYFEEAPRFHRQLGALFPRGLGLRDHVAGLLAALDHGRPFRPPPGPEGDASYHFTTLRGHRQGGYIPPHADNEQALRPSYAHLLGLVEPHLLSFVLAFQAPEAGGALEVYDHRTRPHASELMNDDAGARVPVDRLASVSFHLPAGTLIVLDSGAHLHRVAPVIGTRMRWTACSFMARSRARDAVYCWG